MGRIIFVTGTDTGVGKTLLTSLLVTHARAQGLQALAMKPFCSGGRRDAKILYQAQQGEIPLERVNPFWFREPLAPLVAGRRQGEVVERKTAVDAIRGMAECCELLLVEGAGGLVAPLGIGFSFAELIRALDGEALIVVRNKLGAINHTLLTLARLRSLEVPQIKVVLMDQGRESLASETNFETIRELAAPAEVFRITFLGPWPLQERELKKNAKKLKKTLARILGIDMFSSAFSKKRSGIKKSASLQEKERD